MPNVNLFCFPRRKDLRLPCFSKYDQGKGKYGYEKNNLQCFKLTDNVVRGFFACGVRKRSVSNGTYAA